MASRPVAARKTLSPHPDDDRLRQLRSSPQTPEVMQAFELLRALVTLDGGRQDTVGSLCGWLSEFVACQTIPGLTRAARNAEGHDATYGRGKKAQIKGVGAISRTGFTVKHKYDIDRLIVIRVWEDGWAVIYDGSFKRLQYDRTNDTHHSYNIIPLMRKAVARLEREAAI